MATLHLTNVPPEVIAWLEAIAAAEQTTVNVVAVRQLQTMSRRAGDDPVLDSLPETGLSTSVLLHHLDAGRGEL